MTARETAEWIVRGMSPHSLVHYPATERNLVNAIAAALLAAVTEKDRQIESIKRDIESFMPPADDPIDCAVRATCEYVLKVIAINTAGSVAELQRLHSAAAIRSAP